MQIDFLLNFVGLICNIIGTIYLSFSLSRYLTAMHGAIALHDMTLKGLMKGSTKILDADIGNLLTKGIKSGRHRTFIGLALISIGFILQLIPYIMELM